MTVKLSDEQAKALGLEAHIPKRVARANPDPDGMNKTERRYARKLDEQVLDGIIMGYWFEAVKFRLANRCWYCPDFLVRHDLTRYSIVETKGNFIREDGWIKLKVAADIMPFPFYLAQWTGRVWEITRIQGRSS